MQPKRSGSGAEVQRTAAPRSRRRVASGIEAGVATAVALEPEPARNRRPDEISVESAREAVLAALEDAGQQMLAHNLEEGEWSLRGIEVRVTVAMSQVLIDVALGPEPKRVIQTALSKAAGRPLKFKMVSGGAQVALEAAQRRVRPMARERAAGPRPILSCSACRKNLAPRFAP